MRGTLSRLGWFVGIWTASVVAIGLVAVFIRLWLR
jgi:hypothetical protein